MADSFKAATWNVYHGTRARRLEPILKGLLRDGVSLILLQEVERREVRKMLRDNGLRLAVAAPEYVVAFDPDVWERVQEDDVVLSRTNYFTRKGHAKTARLAKVVLRDRAGRTITAGSYHTPSGVQHPNPPRRRMRALRQAMKTLSRLGRRAKTDAVLFGGDDNVDEARSFRRRWRFMRGRVTGLRQVRAPKGTHGKRRIDDFRTRGLKPLNGSVRPGGGDHKIHVRRFRWTK